MAAGEDAAEVVGEPTPAGDNLESVDSILAAVGRRRVAGGVVTSFRVNTVIWDDEEFVGLSDLARTLVFLLITGTRAQRWAGGAALLGLCAKIVGESPWGDTLRHPPGWDIAVVPLAHATGALAGALCATVASWPLRAASAPNEHA